MKITKSDLYEALIQARVSLSNDIRHDYKSRRLSYVPDLQRKALREKIAAYRMLSSLFTLEAETYTDSRTLRKIQKILAK